MSLREQETRRILLNTQYELAQIRPQLSQMGQELRDMRYQEETSLEEKNEMFLKMTQAVKDKEDFEESFDDRLVQDVLHIKKNLEDEKQKWMKEVEAEFEQKLAAKDAEHANDLDKQLDDLMVFMNNDFNAIKENNNADIAILKDQIKKLEEALAKALSSSEQPLLDSTEVSTFQLIDDLPLY